VLGKSWPLIIAIQNSSDVEGIGGFKSELEANEWIAKDLARKEGQSTNHHAEEMSAQSETDLCCRERSGCRAPPELPEVPRRCSVTRTACPGDAHGQKREDA
jgi:hypothetical protein